MNKFITLAMAATLTATASAATGNLKITFNGSDNANWSLGQDAVATVENGHCSVDMVLQSNEKYRADLKFASTEEPIILSPTTDQIFAIKFIGAKPNGNMSLEFKNSDNTWYNKKWNNFPQGTVATKGGNTIYYYELNRDENYVGDPISIVNLNLKIADCATAPYKYTIDWIATYASIEELTADANWADDGINDKDEQISFDDAVLYSSVTSTIFADFKSAIESAEDNDVIIINKPVDLSDRMSIKKSITFEGANENITITRNFTNKLFLIIENKDANEEQVVVTFKNVNFSGNGEDCTSAFIEDKGTLNLENVTFSNVKTTSNQGIVAMKQGGRVNANNVLFENCTLSDIDMRLSTFFLGSNCSMSLAGDCGTSSVYIEKAGQLIEAGELTNAYAIVINLGDMDNRELESVVVKGCDDVNQFALKNENYKLEAKEGNLVLVKEEDGITAIETDEDTDTAIYYNLHGIKVKEPTNGIYLMVKGGITTKTIK